MRFDYSINYSTERLIQLDLKSDTWSIFVQREEMNDNSCKILESNSLSKKQIHCWCSNNLETSDKGDKEPNKSLFSNVGWTEHNLHRDHDNHSMFSSLLFELSMKWHLLMNMKTGESMMIIKNKKHKWEEYERDKKQIVHYWITNERIEAVSDTWWNECDLGAMCIKGIRMLTIENVMLFIFHINDQVTVLFQW